MPANDADRDSITAKTARSAGWLLGWRLATRVLGLCSTLVLVRILVPADFGVVALGTGFAIAVDALSQIGVQEQLVRETAPDRAMYNTAFTINLARSILTAGLLAASSVAVARFFVAPQLMPIMLALALATLIGGLENIGIVEFRRNFSFDKEFKLSVVPRVASVVATIIAALVLRDYRALVVGILVGRVLRNLYSYTIHPFRPRLHLGAWRRMIGFSIWSWGITVTATVRDRCDSVVVGRVLGSAAVGIYSVGLEVATLPISELIEPIARVLFSSFAAARLSGTSADAGYARVLGVICLLVLPATAGISLIADPLTRLMFGPAWTAAIPLVEILALAGVLRIFSLVGGTLLTASGLPRLTCQAMFAATCIRVPLVVALVTYGGLIGCAWAVLAATAVEEAFFMAVTSRRFGLGLHAFLQQVWRPLLATAAMAAFLDATGLGWRALPGGPAELGGSILLTSLAGACVFSLTLAALWLISGRPRGAETEVAGLLRAAMGRLAGMVRRRSPWWNWST